MSDKKGWRPKVCSKCARITKRDLERRYCPVKAAMIHPDRPADSCGFFVMSEEWRHDGRHGKRGGDVC